uniref:Complex III subunit 9 n=1 Tax=Astyanax mexicanus TaxID=7994 RepID=A0A8B9GP18_ASTMX
MALTRSVYNLLFKRTSTFAVTIMVGAVLFERVFDQGGDALYESINRGVSEIFKEHRYNYISLDSA